VRSDEWVAFVIWGRDATRKRQRVYLMADATSVEQIGQGKPRGPRGAPARTRSHYDAILALLRERGPRGVLGSELYDAPHLYGRSPRNRISELRADGFVISGQARGSSDWHYVLLPDSSDWYELVTGKPRPALASNDLGSALPLFDAVVRR
jgi:hypothetical protein